MRSAFHRELAARSQGRDALSPADARQRTWLFVPYDQLSASYGPLARFDPREVGIVLVEAPAKAARRPYHQQKLAYVLTNLRHFALEQASRGVAIRHVVAPGSYGDALRSVVAEVGPLTAMVPAERELREDLSLLRKEKGLRFVRHEGWMTTQADFRASQEGPPWRMDAFYRHVRKQTGILMTGGKPDGGRFSFDTENRKRWTGTPLAPDTLSFVHDDVTHEVGDLIEQRFSRHPGVLRLSTLPATAEHAEEVWQRAKSECLPNFGPYEDAMSTRSRRLFHTGISPLLNLGRLVPARVVKEAADSEAPLPSREGFVRQILGWREYMHHVHVETDGFRTLAGTPIRSTPGDGGYHAWSGSPWPTDTQIDGGADASYLAGSETISVPPAYWGKPSNLRCLDEVVESVWDEGYSHHITRLMVLSNLAMLLDVSPRDLTDWFWVAYVDAYDWVVEPNVLAMGTFGTGDVLTTKPYVAGSAYIDKMSDYCRGCAFDPKSTCPFPRLYWAFLERHRDKLAGNPRMKLPVLAASKRDAAEKSRDRETFDAVRSSLARGDALIPSV